MQYFAVFYLTTGSLKVGILGNHERILVGSLLRIVYICVGYGWWGMWGMSGDDNSQALSAASSHLRSGLGHLHHVHSRLKT